MALVAQDGIEEMDIPWPELDAIFIGGGDPWKDSNASIDIVKTAKTLCKHVHFGRVNQIRGSSVSYDAGADTCDGSILRSMSTNLLTLSGAARGPEPTLWDESKIIEPLPVS